MSTGVVTSIHIYPRAGEPGQELDGVDVLEHGLDGDRSKNAPVSLCSVEEYVATYPKANFVIDLPTAALGKVLGQRIHVGECSLEVVEKRASCGVLYAVVAHPGAVSVGDALFVAGPVG